MYTKTKLRWVKTYNPLSIFIPRIVWILQIYIIYPVKIFNLFIRCRWNEWYFNAIRSCRNFKLYMLSMTSPVCLVEQHFQWINAILEIKIVKCILFFLLLFSLHRVQMVGWSCNSEFNLRVKLLTQCFFF